MYLNTVYHVDYHPLLSLAQLMIGNCYAVKWTVYWSLTHKDGLMKKWLELLTVVLDEFVETKCGVDNMEFWDRICHFSGGGSGPTYLSGWITTFAVFDKDGKWQGDTREVRYFREIIKTDWPAIDTQDVPSGATAVPVLIDDNGTEYEGHMIAGHFAYDGNNTTVQPRADWCIAVGSVKPES